MKIKPIILYTLIATCIISCEMVVDVDLPEFEPSIVLNGVISPDTTIMVALTQDKSALDNNWEFRYIKNATIRLFENNLLIGNLSTTNQEGVYVLNYYPQRGKTYRIEAEKSGFETVSSEITIPADTASFNVTKVIREKDQYGDYIIKLTYTLNDPKIENFYEVKVMTRNGYSKSEYYDYDLDSLIVTPAYYYWQEWYYWLEGANLDDFSDYSDHEKFDDELFNGRQKEFTLYFNEPHFYDISSDTTSFRLEVRNLSEAYYRFATTQNLQSMTGDSPFSEPVQVYSNIENGFGIWGALNNSRSEIIGMRNGQWIK